MSVKDNIIKIMNNLFIIDQKITTINNENKELKKKRDIIEHNLINILKKNKLENKKFILNEKELFLNKCSTLAPLNIKLVKEILNNHLEQYKTNMIITDIEKYRNDNKKEQLKIKRKQSKKSLKKRLKK